LFDVFCPAQVCTETFGQKNRGVFCTHEDVQASPADGINSFLSQTVVKYRSEVRAARQKLSEAVDGSDPCGGEVAPNLSTLLLKKQWLDLILSGAKVWEIRGSATTKRGVIGLAHKQLVFGECKIVDCFPVGKRSTEGILVPCSKEPGDQERFIGINEVKHRILDLSEVCYDKPHAWVLTDIVVYEKTKRLDRKQGQCIWANGPDDGTGHPEEDNPQEGASDVSPDDMAIKLVEDHLQVKGPTNIHVVILILNRKGFIGLTHAWVVHYFEVDKSIVKKKKTHVVEPILPDAELPEERLELQDVISLMQRMPHLRVKLNAAMFAAPDVQALDMQVRQLVADSVVEDKAKLIIQSVQFRKSLCIHRFAKKQKTKTERSERKSRRETNAIQKLFVHAIDGSKPRNRNQKRKRSDDPEPGDQDAPTTGNPESGGQDATADRNPEAAAAAAAAAGSADPSHPSSLVVLGAAAAKGKRRAAPLWQKLQAVRYYQALGSMVANKEAKTMGAFRNILPSSGMLGRWVKACEKYSWMSLPNKYLELKEIPNAARKAVGLTKKARNDDWFAPVNLLSAYGSDSEAENADADAASEHDQEETAEAMAGHPAALGASHLVVDDETLEAGKSDDESILDELAGVMTDEEDGAPVPVGTGPYTKTEYLSRPAYLKCRS
jgi:hypothetical protein